MIIIDSSNNSQREKKKKKKKKKKKTMAITQDKIDCRSRPCFARSIMAWVGDYDNAHAVGDKVASDNGQVSTRLWEKVTV